MTDAPKIEVQTWSVVHKLHGFLFNCESDDEAEGFARGPNDYVVPCTIIDTASLEAERERIAELVDVVKELRKTHGYLVDCDVNRRLGEDREHLDLTCSRADAILSKENE